MSDLQLLVVIALKCREGLHHGFAQKQFSLAKSCSETSWSQLFLEETVFTAKSLI